MWLGFYISRYDKHTLWGKCVVVYDDHAESATYQDNQVNKNLNGRIGNLIIDYNESTTYVEPRSWALGSISKCSKGRNITYRKTSNISRTLLGNKIVENSDVVGASPVGAAPITSSFSP